MLRIAPELGRMMKIMKKSPTLYIPIHVNPSPKAK